MKKRFVVIILAIAMIFSAYGVGYSKGQEKDLIYKQLDIFAEGLAQIERKYVEDAEAKDLIYGAMRGMLASLDSYSEFMDPDEYKDLLVETEGRFGGLGIEITIKEGLLTIVSPLEGTPAYEAGLEPGDIIVKIDGETTKNITINEAVKKLRGEPGTKVTVTLLKEKDTTIDEVTITRGIIKIEDIKRPMILESGVGYIRIAEFREDTAKDLAKALKKLKEDGMKGLILDVRTNPGGLLFSAIEVSSLFVADGKVIVSTRSRSDKEEVYKSVKVANKYIDIPMAVLINKGSASGSEILASALRDNKRAVLIGQKSFGKGSVQTVLPLVDGSAMRLTTSAYYTPNGVSLNKKGIEPDIEVTLKELGKGDDKSKKIEEVFEKVESQEEEPKDKEEKDKFDYKKDSQIIRAVDLIKGLLVLSPEK